MRQPGFWLIYLILLAAQIVLCDCMYLTQLVSLWFLPMMVLCTPVRYDTPVLLAIAFLTGLAVDLLSQGVIGLCTASLLPVALCRNLLIRLVFGNEVFLRGEDISIRRQGVPKMALAISLASALYLLVFIIADSAGTRPFWFNAGRFLLSLLAGTILSVFLAGTLKPDEGQRWK